VAVAQWLLAHRQTKAACLTLTAFNLKVRAQAGKTNALHRRRRGS